MGAYEVQTAVAPELPGDYNRNNVVDAADFVLWRRTRGTMVPKYSGADGNGNGEVDDVDYSIWREHFGETPQMGSAALSSQPADAGVVSVVSGAPIKATVIEVAGEFFVPISTTRSPRVEQRRVEVVAMHEGNSLQQSARELLALSLADPLQRITSDALAGATGSRDASAERDQSRDKRLDDEIFGGWPRIFFPTF
jgi:hypothetical protein